MRSRGVTGRGRRLIAFVRGAVSRLFYAAALTPGVGALVEVAVRPLGIRLLVVTGPVAVEVVGERLVPPAPLIRTAPRFLDPDALDRTQTRAIHDSDGIHPGISYAVLEDVLVSGFSDGAICGGRAVVPLAPTRLGAGLTEATVPGFRATRHGRAVVRVDREPRRVDAGLLLAGFWSDNYYHWLVEVLPRLTVLDRLPVEHSTLPLLVHPFVIRTPSIAESIRVLAGDRKLVPIDPHRPCRVDRLVLIDGPAMSSEQSVSEQSGLMSTGLHSDLFRSYRERLLSGVGMTSDSGTTGRRILIIRPSNGRRLYNQADVETVLLPLGFEAVDPSTLSFAEQVRLFHEASFVCGPSGAAMTNLLFLPPSAQVLIWGFATAAHIMSIWSNLAASAGAEVTILAIPVDPTLTQPELAVLPEYWINPSRIEHAVRILLGEGLPRP